MMDGGKSPPEGWYRNPEGTGERWWDGQRWTEHVRDAGGGAQRPPAPGSGKELIDRIVGSLGVQPRAFWFAVLGLAVIILGSFAPWARAFIVTVSGTEGDGILFIIGAAIAFGSLWAYASTGRRGALIWPILLGAGVAADSAWIIYELEQGSQSKLFGEEVQVAQVQWGIYATMVGGGVVAAHCLYLAFQGWRASRTGAPRSVGPTRRAVKASVPRPSIRTLGHLAIPAIAVLLILGGVAWGLSNEGGGGGYYGSVEECLREDFLAPSECDRLYESGIILGLESGPLILSSVGVVLLMGWTGYLIYRRRQARSSSQTSPARN